MKNHSSHSLKTAGVPAFAFLFGALLLSPGSAQAQYGALQRDTVALVNVNVIPMDRERVLTRRALLIADGRIIALGSVDSVRIPPGARRIDGENRLCVLPGFADMHTHIRYESDLALMLANGITITRNMRGRPWHLRMRDSIAAGALLGPRIVTAGPIFYGGPGSGANPAEARAMVDSQSTAGYDFIKVYDGLSAPSYEAVVQEAAKRGMPVAGHVPGLYGTGVTAALGAHQASIEHAEQFIYHRFADNLDETKIPALAQEVRAAGSYVTPTMSTIYNLIAQWRQPDSALKRPELRYLNPETYAWWKTDPGHDAALNTTFVPFLNSLVRGLRDAGVPLMAGTDYYLFGAVAGFSLHEELKALVAAGLTPYEALAAATRVPAQFLHDTAETGTVAVGKVANLAVLEGNPLTDITQSAHIAGVVLRGRWLAKAELQKTLDSLAGSFAGEQRLVDDILLHGAQSASLRGGTTNRHFGESTLTQVGNRFLTLRRGKDAIATFKLIVDAYPRSADAWEGLADAYALDGKKESTVAALKRALAIDPSRQSALKKLKANGAAE